MENGDDQMSIDIYLAGQKSFEGIVNGIRVTVHPGARPNWPEGGPSCVAAGFSHVRPPTPLPSVLYLKRFGQGVRRMSSRAAEHGRNLLSRRRGRG